MPNVKRTPIRTNPDSGRRPMRPIDREKMRPWLERHLDQGSAHGVRWVNKARQEFEVPWRHAARQGWSIEKDACIFERWACHTKKYIPGKDKNKDPKRWKANFRCALHSLQDVERITGPESKGSNAVRRYRFLTPGEFKHKLRAKKQRKARRYEEETEEEEMEETVDEVKIEVENAEDEIPSPTTIPDFGQLLSDSDVTGLAVSSNHMSGCQIIERCPSPPSPQRRSASPLNSDGASDSEISYTSDVESAEAPLTIEESNNLQNYHPNLWSDFEFSDSMYLGETVELETAEIVIDLTPRAEYWDLSNAQQVLI